MSDRSVVQCYQQSTLRLKLTGGRSQSGAYYDTGNATGRVTVTQQDGHGSAVVSGGYVLYSGALPGTATSQWWYDLPGNLLTKGQIVAALAQLTDAQQTYVATQLNLSVEPLLRDLVTYQPGEPYDVKLDGLANASGVLIDGSLGSVAVSVVDLGGLGNTVSSGAATCIAAGSWRYRIPASVMTAALATAGEALAVLAIASDLGGIPQLSHEWLAVPEW